MTTSNLGWYKFQVVGQPDSTFTVARIDGVERLGSPYRFELDLVSESVDIDLQALLGKTAQLNMRPWGANEVFFHGVITQSRSSQALAERKLMYHVRLEPRLALLGQSTLNEAYVDTANGLNLKNLIDSVFARHGLLPGKDYSLALGSPIISRDFVLQYQETDLAFLNRWVEFEGAFYYFSQEVSGEKVIFIDDIQSLPVKRVALKYRPAGSMTVDQYTSSLIEFDEWQAVGVGKVRYQEYNYRQAQDPVTGSAQNAQSFWTTQLFYGGGLRDNAQANAYAKLRLEAFDAQRDTRHGKLLATGVSPGTIISVTEHPRQRLNAEFLVTTVRHKGTQAGFGVTTDLVGQGITEQNYYTAEFDAVPSNKPYRLPLQTPRPHIAGYLPALVDAEGEGQVAFIDQYGRYKVDLPFDFSDRGAGMASAWVRLAAPFNGPGDKGNAGFHFPLRKGAEVMLAFMDGDPDLPVIVGVLTNSLSPSPVNDHNASVHRIVSSAGHEFHMDDTPGSEGVRIKSSDNGSMILIGTYGGGTGK
ncbi:MAG: type VI secretion system tip protein VgrG [Candidatus Methylopumilus sp.]|nr:type VI secretion system tip protein VgrG [Candidatus Methylopumilus sp.]